MGLHVPLFVAYQLSKGLEMKYTLVVRWNRGPDEIKEIETSCRTGKRAVHQSLPLLNRYGLYPHTRKGACAETGPYS
jgi:hypothetical protein